MVLAEAFGKQVVVVDQAAVAPVAPEARVAGQVAPVEEAVVAQGEVDQVGERVQDLVVVPAPAVVGAED